MINSGVGREANKLYKIDGWPIIGEIGPDGLGRMVWSGKKPVTGTPIITPQTNDEFDHTNLPPQWEWNYQLRADMWSLRERPGWLRLRAFRPLQPDTLLTAGNTLTQRTLRTSSNEVVLKLDLSGMTDGQKAGLCHFSRSHSELGISQIGRVRALEFRINDRVTLALRLPVTCSGCGPLGVGMAGASIPIASTAAGSRVSANRISSLGGITGGTASPSTTSTTNPIPVTWMFVSWRLLGTEPDDIAFNVYRATGTNQPAKLNQTPITQSNSSADRRIFVGNFVDKDLRQSFRQRKESSGIWSCSSRPSQ